MLINYFAQCITHLYTEPEFSEAFLPESPDTSDLGRCRAFKTTTVRVFVVDW